MSAEWRYDARRREHTLAAGAITASVAASRSGTRCSLGVRVVHESSPGGSHASELTLMGWYSESDKIDADKARLEAEIRRLATEALAALPAAPPVPSRLTAATEAARCESLARECEREGLRDQARELREIAAEWRKRAGGAS